MSAVNQTNGVEVQTLLHKRILALIKAEYNRTSVEEYKVLELSPSGKWMKLQNIHGAKFWKSIEVVTLVETLTPIIKSTFESERLESGVVITEDELLAALKDSDSEKELSS